jgi:phospholipid-binding lipoprotein MlaA
MKIIFSISILSMLCLVSVSVPCLAEDLTRSTAPRLGFEDGVGFLTREASPEAPAPFSEDEGPIQVALANIPPKPSSEEGAVEIEMIPDPLEPVNRAFFQFNDKFYFWVLKPVASGYKAVVPENARVGVRNFFSNVATPIRLVNCLLQAKFECSGKEALRFLVNSTFGLAGFLDTAKKEFHIEKEENDLGITLGVWGIGPAFYINWPILGPSSLRDTVGYVGDLFLDPTNYLITSIPINLAVKSYYQVNEASLTLGEYEDLKKAALDPYIALKDAYHQYMQTKIRKK